jgi:hypothetical protein
MAVVIQSVTKETTTIIQQEETHGNLNAATEKRILQVVVYKLTAL